MKNAESLLLTALRRGNRPWRGYYQDLRRSCCVFRL